MSQQRLLSALARRTPLEKGTCTKDYPASHIKKPPHSVLYFPTTHPIQYKNIKDISSIKFNIINKKQIIHHIKLNYALHIKIHRIHDQGVFFNPKLAMWLFYSLDFVFCFGATRSSAMTSLRSPTSELSATPSSTVKVVGNSSS